MDSEPEPVTEIYKNAFQELGAKPFLVEAGAGSQELVKKKYQLPNTDSKREKNANLFIYRIEGNIDFLHPGPV